MKCQILFSGKNKKNISKCRLLKILPRVLSVNEWFCNVIMRFCLHFRSTVIKYKSETFAFCTNYVFFTEN